MAGRARVVASFIAGVLVLAAVLSCEEELVVAPDRNRAPETIITRAPRERGESGVWARIYWRGWDEDGVVLAYDYAVDDTSFTSWMRTERTDSTFLFRVERDDRDVEHTFYVAAIDNEGKRDPSPAFRTFTAVDRHAPLIDSLWGTYTRPGEPPIQFFDLDTIPAVAEGEQPYEVRFFWLGSDQDGEIVKYFWRIDEGAETEVDYEDTVSALAGAIAPKAADDRTRYILYVIAEDDAGLHGGAGDAGVLPARLAFAVDFTPNSGIDSIHAQGTAEGWGWDESAGAGYVTAPVETSFTWAELTDPLTSPVTFPGEAILTLYYLSVDPEEGCVKEVRWQTQSGAMFSGNTTSPWAVPENCDEGTGTSRVTLTLSNSAQVSNAQSANRPRFAPGWSSGIWPSRILLPSIQPSTRLPEYLAVRWIFFSWGMGQAS